MLKVMLSGHPLGGSIHLLTHLRYGVWLAIFAIGLIVPTAHAQSSDRPQALPSAPAPSDPPDSPDQGFHLGPTPYVWVPGIHGTVGALGHDSSVHASASDVLYNFDIDFMILAEPSYNRIVFPIDYMWVKLSDSKGLPFDRGFYSVKVTVTESVLTPKIGYRFVGKARSKADALWGIRFWYLTNRLTLQPTSPLGTLSSSHGWVDAVSGVKFQIGPTNRAFITIFGDAGEANAKYDYQVGGGLGFQVAERWALQAGSYLASIMARPLQRCSEWRCDRCYLDTQVART